MLKDCLARLASCFTACLPCQENDTSDDHELDGRDPANQDDAPILLTWMSLTVPVGVLVPSHFQSLTPLEEDLNSPPDSPYSQTSSSFDY